MHSASLLPLSRGERLPLSLTLVRESSQACKQQLLASPSPAFLNRHWNPVRYVHLTGGTYCGRAVDRAHAIDGCTFFYSPPPRAAVPFAASLRGPDRSGGRKAVRTPAGAPSVLGCGR